MMRWGVLRLRVPQFSLATGFVVLLCLTCVIAASPVQADTVHAEDIGSSEIGGLDDFRTWHLPHGAIARLGKGRKSSGDLAMDFSPDGRYLAVASAIGVWVFESASGRAAMLLPTVDVKSVSFSPDGATLASTGWDEIELWHVETGTRIGVLSREWLHFPIALISPDGATLASGQLDGSVLLWDIEGRNVIAVLDGHMHGITSLAFSRNGKTLASASNDETVRLWDVAARKEIATLDAHTQPIKSVAFSPDGSILASWARDKTVRLWDTDSRKEIAVLNAGRGDVMLAFSPDGRTLTTGSYDEIIHWDVATRARIATLQKSSPGTTSLAYTPDGSVLLTASSGDTIVLRHLESGSAVRIPGFFYLSSMAMSPDGATLAVGINRGAILQWHLATLTAVPLVPAGSYYPARALAFMPGRNVLAFSKQSERFAKIRLWDLAIRQEIVTLDSGQHFINSMTFSPDGKTLASGGWGDDTVKLWEVATRQEIASLQGGHRETTHTLAFSPDGNTFASGSRDRTAKLWDMATREVKATLRGHRGGVAKVVFSPDGKTLASASGPEVKLWDAASGEEITSLSQRHGVSSVVYSSDGTTMVVGSLRTITLWDMATREQIITLEGHANTIHWLFFSPDESTLISGSGDGTMLIWDMQRVLSRPQLLTGVSGLEQKGPAGTAIEEPYVVSLQDQNGDPYAGATVTFVVTAGGGTLSATTDTTDASGRAATTLTLGSQPGTNIVVASVGNLEPVVFTAIALANPDFDLDGTVGFGDFVLFAAKFGLSRDDDDYEAKYDLDGNGSVGFSDFLIFAGAFGADGGK